MQRKKEKINQKKAGKGLDIKKNKLKKAGKGRDRPEQAYLKKIGSTFFVFLWRFTLKISSKAVKTSFILQLAKYFVDSLMDRKPECTKILFSTQIKLSSR